MIRGFFGFCLLLLGQFLCFGEETGPSVELHWQDKTMAVADPARQQLSEDARKLVESSNFHSGPDDKEAIFSLPGVQRDYRREVAGNYLLISFPTPQKIKTLAGKVMVAEIVIGLNRDDYASNLFTIDSSGRIVGHTKYAGELCIQVFKEVKALQKSN